MKLNPVDRGGKLALLGMALAAAAASCLLAGIIRMTGSFSQVRGSGRWGIVGLELLFIALAFAPYLMLEKRGRLWLRMLVGAIAGQIAAMLSVNIVLSAKNMGGMATTVDEFISWALGSFFLFGWLLGLLVGAYHHFLSRKKLLPCAIIFGVFVLLGVALVISGGLGRHSSWDWHWYYALV